MVEEVIIDPGKPKDEGTPKVEQPKVEGVPVKEEGKEAQYPDVDFDGEKVPFEDLKKGYMRSKDYTQKTQKLAEDTKSLERLQSMADFIDSPDNKAKAERILKIVRGEEEALPPENEDEDPAITKMRDRLAVTEKKLEGFLSDSNEKSHAATLKEIAAEAKEVKAKYPDLDKDDMEFIYAIAEGKPDEHLLKSAERYVTKLAGRDKNTIKSYLESKEKDKKNFVEGKALSAPPADRKISLNDGSAQKAFTETLTEAMK